MTRRRSRRRSAASRRTSRSGRKKKTRAKASAIHTGMIGLEPKPSRHTMTKRNGPKKSPAPASSTLVARNFSQLRSRTARSARSERCSQPCWKYSSATRVPTLERSVSRRPVLSPVPRPEEYALPRARSASIRATWATGLDLAGIRARTSA